MRYPHRKKQWQIDKVGRRGRGRPTGSRSRACGDEAEVRMSREARRRARPRPSGISGGIGGMEERYVLMSGTREFDKSHPGTAAECMGYCEIMGHELRVEGTGRLGEYDRVPCDGDREERRGGPQVVLPGLPERRGQRRGGNDLMPRGGGGVPAGLTSCWGSSRRGRSGPLPGPGRGFETRLWFPREPGQEEGGGEAPRTATHHRKHHQPKGGSIVPPSGTIQSIVVPLSRTKKGLRRV